MCDVIKIVFDENQRVLVKNSQGVKVKSVDEEANYCRHERIQIKMRLRKLADRVVEDDHEPLIG